MFDYVPICGWFDRLSTNGKKPQGLAPSLPTDGDALQTFALSLSTNGSTPQPFVLSETPDSWSESLSKDLHPNAAPAEA